MMYKKQKKKPFHVAKIKDNNHTTKNTVRGFQKTDIISSWVSRELGFYPIWGM
jgi:hypothetical protein